MDSRQRVDCNAATSTGQTASGAAAERLLRLPDPVLGLSDHVRRLRSADRPSAGVGPDRAGALENDEWHEPAAAGVARIPAATAAARPRMGHLGRAQRDDAGAAAEGLAITRA